MKTRKVNKNTKGQQMHERYIYMIKYRLKSFNYNFDLTSIVTLHDPNLLFFDTLY